jgi:hypothetical protein
MCRAGIQCLVPVVVWGKVDMQWQWGGGKENTGLMRDQKEITTIIFPLQVKQTTSNHQRKKKVLLSMPKSRNQV